ncbi:MAG: hypothetical protein GTO30_13865 [Acidobacteria bacterium]|nr:hypothetical protein [Acidobacteriota bacterium]NIQ86438.1 hypothetical protein [Acidobacteriota bacterium]
MTVLILLLGPTWIGAERREEAPAAAHRRALEPTDNPAGRSFLERRLDEISG